MNKTLLKERVLTVPRVVQSSQIDQEAKRRQVLAEVYKLLIRLVEESENQPTPPLPISKGEEKIEKPTIARADPFKQEVFPYLDPEVSSLNTE